MSWDALRDRDSGRPRGGSSRPNYSFTPSERSAQKSSSVTPKTRSVRSRPKSDPPAEVVPAAIEEELWFGGHDSSIAEDAAARSMAALVGRIVGAKPFPESARRLAELTRKEVIRIEPVVQVLERDPALSVRLLRLVNSAGYALRQRCTSVRHAATLVGTDRLHQIATTAAVLDLFDSRGSVAAKIVEHSTIVGAFCRYFGAHLALPVDDLFTAGFLHDIGKLMLLETEGDQYFALLEKYASVPDSIHVVERSLYGFDHAVLAAHVLTAWNIPDPVPKIVAWHHDPTRAYRVSSMMAALVQTVRLADLAVYAMVSGVEPQQFATLASTEAANYLDISEPQLDSMWEELQTLYRESLEQCRGENAPALDPRSLRPKQPLSIATHSEAPRNLDTPRSTELPLQFPCVVCGRPTFGNKCRACGGHMCPEHQEGRDDWCTLCARDFTHQQSEIPQPVSPRLAVLVAIATLAISIAIGYETGGARGATRAGLGTALLIALAALLVIAGRRLMLRFTFVRTRPNRAVEQPQISDGGTHSLVPPTSSGDLGEARSRHDPLTEQLRMSGASLDRVMIREVPSVPSILAPKPFDGLTEAVPPSSGKRETTEATAMPSPPKSQAQEVASMALDENRLTLQGQSLVTLPVPATTFGAESGSSEQQRPIRPAPLIEIESDDRISELGLNGLDATPNTDIPIAPSVPTKHAFLADNSSEQQEDRERPLQTDHRSGTFPSSPPTFELQQGAQLDSDTAGQPQAQESLHPLAALGLGAPSRASKRPSSSRPPEPLEKEASQPGDRESAVAPHERQTLLGITANEIARAAQQVETTTAPSPPSETVPSQASPNQSLEVRSADAIEPAPSAPLPASEAVPSQPSPNQSVEARAANASELEVALERQFLNSMSPEFQSKVMDLVASRVAAIVAERMLESLGHGGGKPGTEAPRPTRARRGKTPAASEQMPGKPRRRKAPQG